MQKLNDQNLVKRQFEKKMNSPNRQSGGWMDTNKEAKQTFD